MVLAVQGARTGSLLSNLVKGVAKSFLPRSITDRVDTAKRDFRNIADEFFEQISDRLEASKNPLFQSLAGVFGNKRAKINTINMGGYIKDPLPWNGISQKALTEVIPELLTQINTSINKGRTENQYYDYSSGKFMSRSQIQKRYDDEYRDRINASMNPAIQRLTDALEASGKSRTEQNAIFKEISALFDDAFAGGDIRKATSAVRSKLTGFGLDGSLSNAIEREVSSGIRNAIRQINDLNNDIQATQSVYRNLMNRSGEKDLVESKRDVHRNRGYDYRKFNRDPRSVIRGAQTRLGITGVDLSKDIDLQQQVLNVLFTGYDKSTEDGMIESLLKAAFGRVSGQDSTVGKLLGGPRITRIREGIAGGIERIDGGTVGKVLDWATNNAHDRAFNFADDFSTEGVRRKFQELREKARQRREARARAAQEAAEEVSDQSLGNGPGAAGTFFTRFRQSRKMTSESTAADTVEDTVSRLPDPANMTINEAERSGKVIDKALKGLQSEQASGDLSATITNAANAVRTSMSAMVGKFIGWGANIFGKNGLLGKLWNSDTRKKLSEKLFTGENAVFGTQYQTVKDWGRDIWNRTKAELGKGYDFVRDSALKFKYGEDYEQNEKYQNSRFWSEFTNREWIKDRMAQAREKAEQRRAEREAARAAREAHIEEREDSLGFGPGPGISKIRVRRVKTLGLHDVANIARERLGRTHPVETFKDGLERAKATINRVADNIKAVGEATVGDLEEDPKTKMKHFGADFMTKLKTNLPKALAGGIVGAGIGALNMGSTGALGALLGPAGPIAGAIVGSGLSILSKTEAFQSIMFGKLNEETGEREGGLISQKMRERFKSMLPSAVGGAAVGALHGAIKGALGFNKGAGVLGMQLLPGGVLGGAVIGAGIGLLKNSESFNNFLFGPKDADGKRSGTFLSNTYNKVRGMFTGGLKDTLFKGLAGAGVGALTGTVLSNMGFLPSMLSLGGPIGMGIAGLGLGIASTSKRFNEYIFGTEYVGDDGKKHRREDGLLSKVRNLINVNLVEPIGNAFKEKLADTVDWIKDKIADPFRLAFGPLADSFKQIGDDIREFAKEKMESFGKTLYNATFGLLKNLFRPFTKLIGKIGQLGVSALAAGTKLALSPVSAVARGASLLFNKKRRTEEKTFRKSFREYLGSDEGQEALNEYYDIVEDGGKNKRNFIQRAMDRRDLRRARGEFADAFRSGYNAEMEEQGLNNLDWRSVIMEKRQRKTDRKARRADNKMWNGKIYKARQDIINKDLRGNSGVTLSDEAVATYRDRFAELGIGYR